MRLFTASPRFWLTFGAIVLIFAVTGPYGTSQTMGPAERFGYWLSLHAVTWTIAITFSVLAEILLRRPIMSMFWRMMTGSIIAALPIGLALTLLDLGFLGTAFSFTDILRRAIFAVPLCALFCLLTFLAMREKIVHLEASPPAHASAGAPILDRLKPQNRGELIRLSVQDHYTEVVTTRGKELVLLRFADAIRETGATAGLQVHRSHWVADAQVKNLKRDNGKLFVVMKDGAEIPVSRTFQSATREHYAGR
jgi:DNA-binding LytR/AlgR family response regulator